MGQAHSRAKSQTAVSYKHTEGLGPLAAPCRARGPPCAQGSPRPCAPLCPVGQETQAMPQPGRRAAAAFTAELVVPSEMPALKAPPITCDHPSREVCL